MKALTASFSLKN